MSSDGSGIVTTSEDFSSGLRKVWKRLSSIRIWNKRKQLITAGTVLVLIALFIWLIVLLRTKAKPAPAASRNLSIAQANKSAIDAIKSKNYSGAAATLSQQTANPNDRGNLQLLATAYEGQKNYSQALATLQKIQSMYGLDYNLAISLGQAEQFLGNKTDAIKYYQQAIDLMKKAKPGSIPNVKSQIQSLQKIINGLQK